MIGEKMIYISELLEKLNNEYKLNINNKENYKKAFTHSSYVNENKKYSFTSFRIDAILIDINKSLIGSINHFKGIKI